MAFAACFMPEVVLRSGCGSEGQVRVLEPAVKLSRGSQALHRKASPPQVSFNEVERLLARDRR